MSEPHQPEKTELETVVNWRMIAAGAGLAVAVLVATVAVVLLSGPRTAPGKEQALARPAAPPRERSFVFLPPQKKTAAPGQSATVLEPLPPPDVEEPPPTPAREPARVAAAPPAPAPKKTVREAKAPASGEPSFKRFRPYGEGELFYLLDRLAKELDLDGKEDACKKVLEESSKAPDLEAASSDKDAPFPLPKVQPVLDVIAGRADLKGLPVRKGSECQSGAKAAEVMARFSSELRTGFARRGWGREKPASSSVEIERGQELVKFLQCQKDWRTEEGIPALEQMLQAESTPVRQEMVAMLASIKGEKASAALARRAVFDLSAEVREAAVKALAKRPRQECRPVLLDGLRYPWAPAADHAAEALVSLNDHESVFALAGLLDEPDPAAPVRDKDKKWTVTEVVRVNHLRNCLLCHAPSFDARQPIRGLVPEKGQPVPVIYHESKEGTFVRADVVYLKQDFSLTRPVTDAAPWPTMQRLDYLTRQRELTKEEVKNLPSPKDEKAPPAYPQRQAVLWALRELTGEDAGDRSEDWHRRLIGWYFGMDL